jgi:hypothetical protein
VPAGNHQIRCWRGARGNPKVLALVLMGVIFLVAAAVNLVLGP